MHPRLVALTPVLRAQEDAGGPNLNVQQEILHLRETAVLFTHKVRSSSSTPPSALRRPANDAYSVATPATD